MRNLLKALLQVDPAKRPTIQEILDFPGVQEQAEQLKENAKLYEEVEHLRESGKHQEGLELLVKACT